MKILSPVGNIESLKAAIYNGADEVYLGVNEFNARNNIDGFNLENLEEAVSFAHLFGVKVALAINILFSDCELEDALKVAVIGYQTDEDVEGLIGGIIATKLTEEFKTETITALLFDSKESASDFADTHDHDSDGKWVYYGTEGAIEDFTK